LKLKPLLQRHRRAVNHLLGVLVILDVKLGPLAEVEKRLEIH